MITYEDWEQRDLESFLLPTTEATNSQTPFIPELPIEIWGMIHSYQPDYFLVYQFVCKAWKRQLDLENVPAIEVALRNIAKSGDLEVLQWARKNGCPMPTCVLEGAAETGCIHILQWIEGCQYLDEFQMDKIRVVASKYGHLHILKWLVDIGSCVDNLVVENAAEAGHLHIIKWAYPKITVPSWRLHICKKAAYGGQLDI